MKKTDRIGWTPPLKRKYNASHQSTKCSGKICLPKLETIMLKLLFDYGRSLVYCQALAISSQVVHNLTSSSYLKEELIHFAKLLSSTIMVPSFLPTVFIFPSAAYHIFTPMKKSVVTMDHFKVWMVQDTTLQNNIRWSSSWAQRQYNTFDHWLQSLDLDHDGLVIDLSSLHLYSKI